MHGSYRITFISNVNFIFFTYSYIHKEWNYYSANLWSYRHWQWYFGSLVPEVIKIFGRDSQDQYWLDFWIFGSDGGTVAGAAHTCDVFLIKSSFRLSRRRIVKIALWNTHWHDRYTSVPWIYIEYIQYIQRYVYVLLCAHTWAVIPKQDRIVNSTFAHTHICIKIDSENWVYSEKGKLTRILMQWRRTATTQDTVPTKTLIQRRP